MQEEYPLSRAPERRRAELVPTGRALRDSVSKVGAHVMHSQVGKEIRLLVAQSCRGRRAGGESWRMARGASGGSEQAAAIVDGRRADAAERTHRRGLIQEFHEPHERHNIRRVRAANAED